MRKKYIVGEKTFLAMLSDSFYYITNRNYSENPQGISLRKNEDTSMLTDLEVLYLIRILEEFLLAGRGFRVFKEPLPLDEEPQEYREVARNIYTRLSRV